ncbi:MAG: hypothetical protein DI535_07315 [Citrobacter freundii]|nr:MAG: hypothetical protein DI535_07315 [Citrobacter freundii]
MKSMLVFLLMCICNVLFAQQKLQTAERVVLNDTKSPIIWIDSMKTDINHLLVDRASFDSLTFLQDSSIIRNRFGLDTREVLLMYPKKEVKVMRLPEFFDFQGIPAADRKLRVCVNHTLIRFPDYLVIDPAYIKTVQITPKRHYSLLDEAYTGELFLNIMTKDYDNPVL